MGYIFINYSVCMYKLGTHFSEEKFSFLRAALVTTSVCDKLHISHVLYVLKSIKLLHLLGGLTRAFSRSLMVQELIH